MKNGWCWMWTMMWIAVPITIALARPEVFLAMMGDDADHAEVRQLEQRVETLERRLEALAPITDEGK